MNKIDNFKDKQNTNGFDRRPQDATKGGRTPSIRKQLEGVINDDGSYIVEAKDVLSINDDGSVTIKSTSAEQMARKLVKWAMGNKGSESLKAIQMIMEQVDGKPKQTINQNITEQPLFPDRQAREERIDHLIKKRQGLRNKKNSATTGIDG